MRDMLEQKLRRFEELEKLLVDPEVLADSARLAAVAREHGSLAKLATKYRRFRELNAQINEARELAEGHDAEMRELAEAELPDLKARREELWNELLDLTIGGEDANRNSCIMEIRAGTGGEEAALFARDLYEMYKHYAEERGWKVEILGMSPTELGGFKEITLGLEGEGVFRNLQFESGGHRVQRVPETESQGRIHTSLATVAVLPEPEDVDVKIDPDDIEMSFMRSSGPGGQKVNKTSSCVRLVHKPTGLTVRCQDEKSQQANRKKAMKILRAKLYELEERQAHAERDALRRAQVGSGDRTDRIRTYNFPQDRITDHRAGVDVFGIEGFMLGDCDRLFDALVDFDKQRRIREFVEGTDESVT
jgi:peptide chain release factor 1